MKSLFQFFFSLFFVSFLLGQETAFDPSHQKRNAQLRQAQDPRSAFNDPAQRNKFVRERQTILSSSALRQSFHFSRPKDKFSGDNVDTAWVRHYSPGTTEGDEYANAIKVDTSGNVYVTGSSSNGLNGDDYYTVKYDLGGNIIWDRYYNSFDFYDDHAECLAIDGIGNVFVTGSSWSGKSQNYTTIKYNSSGDIAWVKKYMKPGNSDGIPTAMTVDKNGNVFVTGTINGPDSTHDYLTIKYDRDGNEIWAKQYACPDTGDDVPSAIVVDKSGNAYVTGSSNGDYATIKYSAYGDSIWVKRYNGSNNDIDFATAISIDDSDHVYVTGGERVYRNRMSYLDSWGQTTIKYDPEGNTDWIQHSPGSGASLAVDADGSIYTAGFEAVYMVGGSFFITKFTPSGDTVWQLKRPTFYYVNYLNSILDNFGNLYVVISSGMDGGTRIDKYKNNGTLLWTKYYSGINCISAVGDKNGSLYTVGIEIIHGYTTENSFAVEKYTSYGDTAWVRFHHGLKPQSSTPTSLDVDKSGNVIVVGESEDPFNFDGASSIIIKYNPTGDLLWEREYKGSNEYNVANDIAVDHTGNIYVSVISSKSAYWSINCEYHIVKYNADGDTLWVQTYFTHGNYSIVGSSMILDESGNVYTAVLDSGNLVTIKYDANGNTNWIKAGDIPQNGRVEYPSIKYSAGHIYVSGSGYNSVNRYYNSFLIKYTTIGNIVWIKYGLSPGTIDRDGNLYTTGGYKTTKYNPQGDTVWVRQYNGPKNSDDYSTSIIVDYNGSVFITGGSFGSDSVKEITTIKYSSSGDMAWVQRFVDFPEDCWGSFLSLDGDGNIYVTGAGKGKTITLKYSNGGSEVWKAMYYHNGYIDFLGETKGMKIDAAGNIFVVAFDFLSNPYRDRFFTTIKYSQTPTQVNNTALFAPDRFQLSQNYPNPFNPSTTIRYALPSSAHVKLTIHDILGREIATLVNEEQSAGWKEVEWNAQNFASGMYFVNVKSGSYVETKKILLMK